MKIKWIIVDVTNKANPQLIKSITYGNVAYTHQGWLTEDRHYFLVGDELDESDFDSTHELWFLT